MQRASACARKELPRFGGNPQLGCGLVVRELKGHRYLYFWSYEERSWGARRVWTYVGPTARPGTRGRALRHLLEHHQRVRNEVDRRIAALEARASGVA